MDCLSYFDCLTGLTSKWTAPWLHSKKYIIFIVKIFAPSVFGFKWICYKKWTDRPIKLYWYDKPVQNNQYNLCKMWRQQNFSSLRLFFSCVWILIFKFVDWLDSKPPTNLPIYLCTWVFIDRRGLLTMKWNGCF